MHFSQNSVVFILSVCFPTWSTQEAFSQPFNSCWTFHSQAGLIKKKWIQTRSSNSYAKWEVLYTWLIPSENYLNCAPSQTKRVCSFIFYSSHQSCGWCWPELLKDGLQPSPARCKISPGIQQIALGLLYVMV